jgi:RNase P protein component
MREAIRSLLPHISPGYDIIVWASYGIEKGTKVLIEEELSFCLKNMKIITL